MHHNGTLIIPARVGGGLIQSVAKSMWSFIKYYNMYNVGRVWKRRRRNYIGVDWTRGRPVDVYIERPWAVKTSLEEEEEKKEQYIDSNIECETCYYYRGLALNYLGLPIELF